MSAKTRRAVVDAIEASGVVAVIRLREPEKLGRVVEALMNGGVRALEVTMTVPRAVELIAQTAERLPRGFALGAGTVLDPETARQVILAGAQFVVGPTFNPAVVQLCHRYDVACMPGCFTPTEILTAWEAGADVVKVFPATVLGPGFFKDMRGPLPQVRLMPTGGVTLANAGDWIKAGAVAIGVGTAMLDARAIEDEHYEKIESLARQFVDAVAAARGGGAVAQPPQRV
jgi:2-dehydro-3-deoxyphosphogluconate aldolase/(4S)-4-hydroxy-2-oxoglutarate aldolase